MKHLYYTLLFIILISCETPILNETSTDDYEVKKFIYKDISTNNKIKGTKINIPQLLHPRNIISTEDYLIIAEIKSDTIFHVLDKNLTHLRKIGKQGVGPNELYSSFFIGKSNGENQFWANSVANKQLSIYDASSKNILSMHDIRPKSDEMFYSVNLVPLADNSFISRKIIGDEKFVNLDSMGKIVRTYHQWSSMLNLEDIPPNVIASLFQGKIVTDTNSDIIALACIQSDIVELLNMKTGKLISIRGPLHYLPKFEVDYSAGYPMLLTEGITKYCYTDIQIINDKVYALFSGHEANEIYCEQIFVFNLQGDVEALYELDTSIKSFTFDYEHNRFIGISTDENPGLVVFEM